MNDDEECWRPILGCEGAYSASSFGRIRSEPRVINDKNGLPRVLKAKLLKAAPSKSHGYPVVNIVRHGKRHPWLVHRLVAETFLGSPPDGMECAHLDGRRTNPRVENLEWKTHSQNEQDKVLHGTMRRGEAVNLAKLKETTVLHIFHDNDRQRDIARKHGVHQSLVSRIKSGKVWRHITAG